MRKIDQIRSTFIATMAQLVLVIVEQMWPDLRRMQCWEHKLILIEAYTLTDR